MRCSPYLSLSNLPHLHNADLVPAKREMISAHGKLKGGSERSHPHDLDLRAAREAKGQQLGAVMCIR